MLCLFEGLAAALDLNTDHQSNLILNNSLTSEQSKLKTTTMTTNMNQASDFAYLSNLENNFI